MAKAFNDIEDVIPLNTPGNTSRKAHPGPDQPALWAVPALVLAAILLAPTAVAAADAEHHFQSVAPRGAVQRVLIDIPHGKFTIRNGSADTIGISGIASRDYDGQREREYAQKVVDDTTVEAYINGAEAVIRRKFGRHASSWRAQKFTGLDLRIDLPPGVALAFDTSAGEIYVTGDFGDVDITLRAGEVDLRIPKANVRELNASCRIGEVRTHLGDEIITREGILPGRTRYVNAAGRSHVNVHVTTGEVNVRLTP